MPKNNSSESRKPSKSIECSKNARQTSKSPQPIKKKVEKGKTQAKKPAKSGYTEFNDEILNKHPHFKSYIEEDPQDKTRFVCLACKAQENKNYSGQYDFLDRHLSTHRHFLATPEIKQGEISEAIEIFKDFRSGINKEEGTVDTEAVQKLRIELTGFLLKHQLPFSLAPKLLQFNQDILKKYGEINFSATSLSHTTAGQIARSCISKTFKEDIYNDLRNSLFSLSFDESAERNGPSYLCTHVRYIKDSSIQHKILALQEIKESKTGQTLYDMVVNGIFSSSLKEELGKNFVGIVTDRGTNMFSIKGKGIANRLHLEFQDIVVANDFCHLFGLIVKDAIEELPLSVRKMIKGISNHFGYSCLRRSRFQQVQHNLEEQGTTDILAILRYTPTRWSSLYEAAERIKLLWVSLEKYFDEIKYEEKSLPDLSPKNNLFLDLLCSLLKRVNSHILFFQDDSHDYSRIMPKIRKIFCLTAELVIKKSQNYENQDNNSRFEDLIKIPFKDKHAIKALLLPDNEFRSHFLSKFPEISYIENVKADQNILDEFFDSAKNFIIELLAQMKFYLPFHDEILGSCEVLQLKSMDELNQKRWLVLAKNFSKKIDYSAFITELDIFKWNFGDIQNSFQLQKSQPTRFWENTALEYPNLGKLALIVLTLPYSTVSIERTFSVLRQIRGTERNRLCNDSVEACILVHQALGAYELEITQDLLDHYNKMWIQDQKPVSNEDLPRSDGSFMLEETKNFKEENIEEINYNKYQPQSEQLSYISQQSGHKRVAYNPLNPEEFMNPIMRQRTQDYSKHYHANSKIEINLSETSFQEIERLIVKDKSLPNSQKDIN